MTARVLAVLLLVACAKATEPPGGPPDPDAPQLVGTTPDSGQVRTSPREVRFQFDEVVSERPGSAPDLSRLVLISPSNGAPQVRWHRSAISVRPRNGWRDSTTYVVTLLPGITDLRGNVRDSTTVVVFSTGDSIPDTRVTGVVFDWTKGAAAPKAYIEARPATDTSIIYSTEADSLGRFVLPFLVPGAYNVRGVVDANRNHVVDPREPYDTAHIVLRDSVAIEFYAFVQDTANGPRLTSVNVVDSVTLRLVFDQPLPADSTSLPQLELIGPDSTPVAITRVASWSVLSARRAELERERRDSVARADTNTERRMARDRALRDSINRAAAIADSIARDTTRRVRAPTLNRPPLVTEVGVALARPLGPGRHTIRSVATGMRGIERRSERSFERPRPAPTVPSPLKPPPARLQPSS